MPYQIVGFVIKLLVVKIYSEAIIMAQGGANRSKHNETSLYNKQRMTKHGGSGGLFNKQC